MTTNSHQSHSEGKRELKIGVVFPSTDIGTDIAVIREFAQTAEGLGYSHLLLPDHILGAVHQDRQPPLDGPYTENTPFHEPLVLFSYLAAITSRIEFSTGILIAPQRQTVLLAKQAAELAILSGNRFRMAFGTGWNYVEYEALNETWHNRGRRQEEQIDLMRRLWTEHVLDYRGNWHRVDRAGILPRPARPIPIWLGGYNDVVHRRAARLAEGFTFAAVNRSEAQQLMDKIRGYVAECGRDPATFGFEGAVTVHAEKAKWATQLQTWRDLGASHVVVRAMSRAGKQLASPRDHIRALEEYAREVGLT
jgi:probable F420-dependent oxidoreductase